MIISLHIENFKAYRNQRFSIGTLNLLAGLNGSGKSSLLQSLLVLRQSYDQELLQKRRAILNGSLIRLGRFQEALFESADERAITFSIGFSSSSEFLFRLSGWQAGDRSGQVYIQPGPTFPQKVCLNRVSGSSPPSVSVLALSMACLTTKR